MKTSTVLKWVSGGYEVLLGFPVVGGSIIISMLWTPLLVALGLHIATLVFCSQEGTNRHGSVLGIVTSVIGFIPIVGMIMHIITAIVLLIDAGKSQRQEAG